MLQAAKFLGSFPLSVAFALTASLSAASALAAVDQERIKELCNAQISKFQNKNAVTLKMDYVLHKDLKAIFSSLKMFKYDMEEALQEAKLSEYGKPIPFDLKKQLWKCEAQLKVATLPHLKSKRIATLKRHLAKSLPGGVRTELLWELGILTGQVYSRGNQDGEHTLFNKYLRLFYINYSQPYEDLISAKNPDAGSTHGYEQEIGKMLTSAKERALKDRECNDKINQNAAVNLKNTRNQGPFAWCYAFAASDLASHALNQRLSAFSFMDQAAVYRMAAGLNEGGRLKSVTEKGGSIQRSLDLVQGNASCRESTLPTEGLHFSAGKTYAEVLGQIYSLQSIEQFLRDPVLQSNFKLIFSNVDAKTLGWRIDDFKPDEQSPDKPNRILEELAMDQCRADNVNAEKNWKGFRVNIGGTDFSHPALFQDINQALADGEVIGIGYHIRNIFNLDLSGVENDGHASVIVGSRKNNGTCEYLVRNSWGNECPLSPRPGLSCHQNCAWGICANSGHFWISRERLQPELAEIVQLSNWNVGVESLEKY